MSGVALVTGSSRGIGAATARLLASRGYDIAINYVNDERAAEQVLADVKVFGVKAIAVRADVSKEEDIARLFEAVDAELGPLTALVNNAGVLAKQTRVENFDAARINRILATNVTGCLLCCREAVRRMSFHHGGAGGAIVNVSSAAARLGSAGEYVDYAASKGAVDTLTIGLAREVAGEGIRVNAVRPGFIDTDMHASGGEPDRIERVKPSIPMQRGGTADEVAAAIAWLLSDEASYTTGTFVDIAGGR